MSVVAQLHATPPPRNITTSINNMSAVTLILAATVPRLGIGINGGLPWKLSQDMKFFRDVTTGQNKNGVVIMGRRTWESIPSKFRPLKNRTNIVVTSRGGEIPSQEHVSTAISLEEAIQKADQVAKDSPIFVIGGGQLYASALLHPRTRHVLLTEIESDMECDTFFSSFPWTRDGSGSEWARQSHDALESFTHQTLQNEYNENDTTFRFTLWNRT